MRYYQIYMIDENGHGLGYYQQRYYLTSFFANRRARILSKYWRYRKFVVESAP